MKKKTIGLLTDHGKQVEPSVPSYATWGSIVRLSEFIFILKKQSLMLFSSPLFIFIFLPAVLLLVGLGPKKLHNSILLAASLLFYTWGAWNKRLFSWLPSSSITASVCSLAMPKAL